MPLHKEFTRFKLPRGDLSEDKDPTFFICIPRAQRRHTAGIQYTAAKLTNMAHLTKMYQFQASCVPLHSKAASRIPGGKCVENSLNLSQKM